MSNKYIATWGEKTMVIEAPDIDRATALSFAVGTGFPVPMSEWHKVSVKAFKSSAEKAFADYLTCVKDSPEDIKGALTFAAESIEDTDDLSELALLLHEHAHDESSKAVA